MLDPHEGIGPDGCIRTGAGRSQVSAAFEPVLAALTSAVSSATTAAPASLYVYGSVATGTARVISSDVDAVTIGLPADQAGAVGRHLSERFAGMCREVEIGASQVEDYAGDGDEAYGNRAFVRHYCVHLAGSDPAARWPAVPAGVRVARGFNGDLAEHHRRWMTALGDIAPGGADADRSSRQLGRRVARKTLLAVAGLVSVQDGTWTTDRASAAARWSQLHPSQAAGLEELLAWSEGARAVVREDLRRSLQPGEAVERVVTAFGDVIGMWA